MRAALRLLPVGAAEAVHSRGLATHVLGDEVELVGGKRLHGRDRASALRSTRRGRAADDGPLEPGLVHAVGRPRVGAWWQDPAGLTPR